MRPQCGSSRWSGPENHGGDFHFVSTVEVRCTACSGQDFLNRDFRADGVLNEERTVFEHQGLLDAGDFFREDLLCCVVFDANEHLCISLYTVRQSPVREFLINGIWSGIGHIVERGAVVLRRSNWEADVNFT